MELREKEKLMYSEHEQYIRKLAVQEAMERLIEKIDIRPELDNPVAILELIRNDYLDETNLKGYWGEK